MALVAFELLFRFLWGGLVVLTFVSRIETSERFPRISSYIAMGTASFCAFLAGVSGFASKEMYISLALLTVGSVIYAHTHLRWTRILGFFMYLLAPLVVWDKITFSGFYNFLSGALVLGSVYAAQYVGHWYLTVANLHIRELQRVVNVMFLALFMKVVEIAYTLSINISKSTSIWSNVDVMGRPKAFLMEETELYANLDAGKYLLGLQGESYFGLGMFGLIVVITRILWGIVAPVILAYMVKKTVEIRSTQSATGILYAMSVMVLVGEACAIYLAIQLGWKL